MQNKPEQQANTVDTPDVERLLPLPVVIDMAGFKRAKLYQMMCEGTFPKPIKFGRASRWPLSDVQTWIEQQKQRCAA